MDLGDEGGLSPGGGGALLLLLLAIIACALLLHLISLSLPLLLPFPPPLPLLSLQTSLQPPLPLPYPPSSSSDDGALGRLGVVGGWGAGLGLAAEDGVVVVVVAESDVEGWIGVMMRIVYLGFVRLKSITFSTNDMSLPTICIRTAGVGWGDIVFFHMV